MDLLGLKTGGGEGQPKEKGENKWIRRAKNRGGGNLRKREKRND